MRALVSDERLSLRLARGEAEAFDELYRRYVHRLAAYAGSLLGDGAAGEDVAQVSLLNAYQALRRGKAPEKVGPWLYRIAHNEAVDMLSRRRELLQGVELEDRPAPEDATETRGALLDALAKLPDRQRRTYLLREVHGLRMTEIASELSLSTPQVEQALFAARNRLAEELVFGESLTCDAAQRLAEGPLAGIERKALRHHFRTCDRCRRTGTRLAPSLGFDWLRARLAELLVGGAAPAAAKVGAVVAATVATGVTVGPTVLKHEPHFAPIATASAASPRRTSRIRSVSTASTLAARQAAAAPAGVRISLHKVRRTTGRDEHATTGEHDEPHAAKDSGDGEHERATPDESHRAEHDSGESDHRTTMATTSVARERSGRDKAEPPERDRPERERPESSSETTATSPAAAPAPTTTTTTTTTTEVVPPLVPQVTTTLPAA